MALAVSVAALHALSIVLLLTGALLALRYRRALLAHVPVLVAVTAVHLTGSDCPMTTWERALRAREGEAYDGGFLDHYVFVPLGLDAAEPAVQLGIYAVVVVPNLLGYGLLAVRAWRRTSAAQSRVSASTSTSPRSRSASSVSPGSSSP